MNHFATPDFWYCYRHLPAEVRELADKNFALLRQDPHHPSLRLKKVGSFWSARVGFHYRVLARDRMEGLVWFWIGHHSEYDQLGAISPVRENRCVFACFLTQVTRQPRWREACRKAVSFLQQGV